MLYAQALYKFTHVLFRRLLPLKEVDQMRQFRAFSKLIKKIHDNRKNQKAVIVKVNDRGPFAKGRIVDLSFKAASKIDMIRDGIADVEIEIVTTSTEIKDEPIVKNTPKKEDPKATEKTYRREHLHFTLNSKK